MKASLGDNVNLDGGVTAGVVDGAGVDLGDRHVDGLEGDELWISETGRKQRWQRENMAQI